MEVNKIIQGDCLDVMREFEDNSIDTIITDPPYGIGAYKKGTMGSGVLAKQSTFAATDWDNEIPSKEYFDEMFRISKNQIIFGGNYFVEYLKNSSCWLIWDKDNGNNNFADCELIWTSFTTAVRKIKYRWQGMLQADMRQKEFKYHPTQKPLGVMRWIIENYTEEGQRILDPFCGSGSTCIAAKQLKRDYIGIDLRQEYCDIAEIRLKSIQQMLF